MHINMLLYSNIRMQFGWNCSSYPRGSFYDVAYVDFNFFFILFLIVLLLCCFLFFVSYFFNFFNNRFKYKWASKLLSNNSSSHHKSNNKTPRGEEEVERVATATEEKKTYLNVKFTKEKTRGRGRRGNRNNKWNML